MNSYLCRLAAAGLIAAGAALVSTHAQARIRICTFPGSPSTSVDRAVAREVFRTANIDASFVADGIGAGDDDGVSLKELRKTLSRECDVIAGFPRSPVADAANTGLRFSRGYLRSGYVSLVAAGIGRASHTEAGDEVIAAMYGSPAQLIALQQRNAKLHLENTAASTVAAVADGRARRAIVWYPAVVAYERAHPDERFALAATSSPYAEWQLVLAFDTRHAQLQPRIDKALAAMAADGRLAALTRGWDLPENLKTAQAQSQAQAQATFSRYAHREGPMPIVARGSQSVVIAGSSSGAPGRFVKIATTEVAASTSVPSFNSAQVTHGKRLYSSACAKCHGANLQGMTAPALIGPAFAPTGHSHLTIGGVYTYMSTNMPADRPGKLKDQDYADLMAFLLYSNGYRPNASKLTADTARTSTTPLVAGPQH